MMAFEAQPLYDLSRLYGVETAYYDIAGHRQEASAEALLAVLEALGAPVRGVEDVPAALREWRLTLWQRVLEPVTVCWDDGPCSLTVRLPSSIADAALVGHLTLDTGEQQSWQWRGTELPTLEADEVEGARYTLKQLNLPRSLPWGYHRFRLEVPGKRAEALLISAPRKAYAPPEASGGRTWGVFLPLYALHTAKSWGSGDFSDLEAMMEWVHGMGGGVVATLPLLASFLDEPFEPSPYVPASRLLWNELYLDVTKVPELQRSPAAQALIESPSFSSMLEELRGSPLVDYRKQMALKRQVLEELARSCFTDGSERLQGLMRFAGKHPVVENYARFRAAVEKQAASWPAWPSPLREGILREGDYNEETRRYHLYVQWLAHEQLRNLAEKSREKGLRLYFDFPLGVHPHSYDVWRERDVFVLGVSAGAPPDTFFVNGQEWAFPPLHPERIRERGYRYYIACLRHQLQNAGILRIDHVMGLHRLFWIPYGLGARHGVYVRYQADELYAILVLESHRNRAILVGEDLGTVPPEVRPAMAEHGLHRAYVVQYELSPNIGEALSPVPSPAVASLNTHDMSTFAAFWQGLDIAERREMSLLDEAGAKRETELRQSLKRALVGFLQHGGWAKDVSATEVQWVLRAILAFLGASPARIVLVNLEDLWLETQPQNVPGTGEERPNWRRKARLPFEAFSRSPEVIDLLREVERMRHRA